jgi:RNA polymerase sigma-B factor
MRAAQSHRALRSRPRATLCRLRRPTITGELKLSFRSLSLDDADGGSDSWLQQRFGRLCPGLQAVEDRLQAGTLVNRLPENQQQVLRLRSIENLSQREIGERIGLTQMTVCRLLHRSFDTMRAAAG